MNKLILVARNNLFLAVGETTVHLILKKSLRRV